MKDNFIFQWIFNSQIKQEKDIESYCKANIFSAKNSLERIILKLETEKSNEEIQKLSQALGFKIKTATDESKDDDSISNIPD